MFVRAWRAWRLAGAAVSLALSAPTILPAAWDAAAFAWAWNEPFVATELREEAVETDDPAALLAFHLKDRSPADYSAEAERALAEGDAELAQSIAALAAERHVPLPGDLLRRIDDIQPDGVASNVWQGVLGESDSVEGFAAELTTDLFVIGDLRDLAKQAWAYPEQDDLVVVLAAAGVAASVATGLSAGAAAPAKLGISTLKIAKRAGKLNPHLLAALSRTAMRAVDGAALRRLGRRAWRLDWSGAAAEAAEVVDRRVVRDFAESGAAIGRVAGGRGPKAALETLDLARSTRDLKVLDQVSDRAGKGYRGALKLSRGALVEPIRVTRTVRKWAKRGAMAAELALKVMGWLLSGLVWLLWFQVTAVRLLWRLGRVLTRRRGIRPRGLLPTGIRLRAPPQPVSA